VNPDDRRALLDGSLERREDNLRALIDRARDGDESATAALRALVRDYPDYHRNIYSQAMNQADAFGDATLEAPLLAALADTRYNCQAWAAMGATALGIHAAVPGMLKLLDHTQWIARKEAVVGLGELGDESVVPALVPLLQNSEDWMRECVADALSKIGGEVALAALWDEFDHRRFQRIGYIASALATFTPAVVPRLIDAASSDDPDTRYWAAIALGSTGDERARPALEMLTSDKGSTVFDGWVSVAGKKGLRTLGRIQAAIAARANT
jgi:HEAT repeat protein